MKARTRWIAVALTLGLSAVVIAQPPATITPALAGVASLLTFGAPVDTGISRTAAGTVAVGNGTQGDTSGTLVVLNLLATGNISTSTGGAFTWNSITKSAIRSSSDGVMSFENLGSTTGSKIKVDALPTVASGFGTSPAVTAGSTPFAGSINVGTGAPGTGGVINFNGTAFPSAPFVVCQDDSSLLVVRCTATTTQMTIAATALTASDVVSWIAISSK
jgi:hypothetical protein